MFFELKDGTIINLTHVLYIKKCEKHGYWIEFAADPTPYSSIHITDDDFKLLQIVKYHSGILPNA